MVVKFEAWFGRFWRLAVFTLMGLLLVSCRMDPGYNFVGEPLRVAPSLQFKDKKQLLSRVHDSDKTGAPETVSARPATPSRPLRSYASSYTGPDSKSSALPLSREKKVSLAVDNLKLDDFVDYVFANVLHVDFVKDPKISRKKDLVTMNLEKGVSEYRLFSLVREQLQRFGVGVYYRNGVFYVWEMAKLAGARLGFGTTEASVPEAARVNQLIPIRYANASNLVNFLHNSRFNAEIRSFYGENLIEVVGSRDQVIQVVQMVQMLDRPSLRGRYVDRLSLENLEIGELVGKLKDILVHEGIPVAKGSGSAGVYFIPLEDWQALLVFAAEKSWLRRVRYWTRILDVPSRTSEKNFFVYFPKNSKAVDLAASLRAMMGVNDGSGTAGATSETAPPATTPPAEVQPAAARTDVGRQTSEAKESISSLDEVDVVNVIGPDLHFGVDEKRNALIFFTTGENYNKVHSLLSRLDVLPLQVLLEVTLAEVTLKGDLAYGVEWYLRHNTGDGSWMAKTMEGLGLGSTGFNFSYIDWGDKFRLVINAMAKDELVKILSTPRLMVRDGVSASMNIGTDVPILSSETSVPDLTVDGNTGVVQSIQYRTTGVTLNVTPTVHARGAITLEISQVVSEAQTNNTSDINSPLILNREVTTEVVAGDGQTVVLAGLIKEASSQTENRVPWIGDLPLVGNLFKTTSRGRNKTELVVMITPHIIHSREEVRDLKKAIFSGFEWLNEDEDTVPPLDSGVGIEHDGQSK